MATGYQHSRFVNTAQVEDLASRGYVVVTMDHTHETPVEFHGGRFLPGVPASQLPDPDFTRTAVETRTADARFVLDQLERIVAGENPDAEGNDLDGTLQDDAAKGPLGEVARKGLDRPFLLLRGDSPKFPEVCFTR